MKKQLRSKPGFTLPEVIIALMVLSMTSIAAVNAIIYIFGFIQLNQSQIIATNLAREGIEIIRNQRDTNWMYWSGSMRDSWNNSFDGVTDIDRSDMSIDAPIVAVNPESVEHLYYIVQRNPFDIELVLSDENGDGNRAETIEDLCANPDDAYRLYYNDADGYNINNDAGDAETSFYRTVEITYFDEDMNITEPDNSYAGHNNANVVRVVSMVGYCHNGTVRLTELETYLTDWYQRTSQTD